VENSYLFILTKTTVNWIWLGDRISSRLKADVDVGWITLNRFATLRLPMTLDEAEVQRMAADFMKASTPFQRDRLSARELPLLLSMLPMTA
jgi:hypothetical protein